MKKLFLAIITSAAIASGAYLITQQEQTYSSLPQLNYVPADTLFFWSQFEGAPFLKYWDMLPLEFKNTEHIDQFISSIQKSKLTKNRQFIVNLIQAYSSSLHSSAQFADTWGVDDDFKFISYSVGLLPVVRAQLANVDTFLKTIKKAADDAGLRYESSQFSGLPVTRFFIKQGSEKHFDIVVSTKGNWITFTADTPFNDEHDLKIALAASKPKKSLNNTDKIQKYIQNYKLDGKFLAYINTTSLVDVITAKELQSNASKMLNNLLVLSDNQDALEGVRNQQCQEDLSTIASQWPAIIFGTKKVDITNHYADIKISTVLASTNTNILNVMTKARGFLPKHTTKLDNAIVSLALGVNATQILPTVNTLWANFVLAEFSCPPLVMAQRFYKEANPASLAMMTGILGSFKGVSISLYSVNITENTQKPKQTDFNSLDLLVTLSANDVEALFNLAKSLDPTFAKITLPKGGAAVEVNRYLPFSIQISTPLYLALKGQHLALYTGTIGERFANTLTDQTVEANGVMALSIDSNALLNALNKLANVSDQEIPKELDTFTGHNTQLHLKMDISDKGIITDTELMLKK